MLYEFADIIDIQSLPSKLGELKWHITGFVDGDGSFPVVVSPVANRKFGWLIQPRFQVELRNNSDSLTMLKVIARTMRINPAILQAERCVKLTVTNRRLLREKVIPFFQEYKLYLKNDDLLLMKYIADSLDSKRHLEIHGFREMVVRLFSLPKDGEDRRKWTLKEILGEALPPSTISSSALPSLPDGAELRHYFSGFIDAEGALGYAVLSENKTITPYLTITHQNLAILKKLQQNIRCGNISTGRLQIYGIDNATEKVIPYLDKHQLIAKRTSYKKFKEVLGLVMARKHKEDFAQVVTMIRSLNDRGILRDHTLSTYPKKEDDLESEDMVQHRNSVA